MEKVIYKNHFKDYSIYMKLKRFHWRVTGRAGMSQKRSLGKGSFLAFSCGNHSSFLS
jgi:hypothetical protein